MKRPNVEDFRIKHANGFIEMFSLINQYSGAQDDYIDHLENKIKHLQDNHPPIEYGKPRLFLDDFVKVFEDTIKSCIQKARESQNEISDLDVDDGYFDQWIHDLQEMLYFINEK